MLSYKWHIFIGLVALWLACEVHSGKVTKKLGELRQKHDYYEKRELVNQTLNKRSKIYKFHNLREGLKQNNTKREYVYYPEGGNGHFRGFPAGGFDDCGDDCGGGPVLNDCGNDGGCDDVPEFTHTHHVVRYHHHVGKAF